MRAADLPPSFPRKRRKGFSVSGVDQLLYEPALLFRETRRRSEEQATEASVGGIQCCHVTVSIERGKIDSLVPLDWCLVLLWEDGVEKEAGADALTAIALPVMSATCVPVISSRLRVK